MKIQNLKYFKTVFAYLKLFLKQYITMVKSIPSLSDLSFLILASFSPSSPFSSNVVALILELILSKAPYNNYEIWNIIVSNSDTIKFEIETKYIKTFILELACL